MSIELNVKQHGFSGFYFPVDSSIEKKAVIVLGGSDGTVAVPKNIGALLSDRGIPALGVCFWNRPGLPQKLVRVPVEYIESAVKWLQNKGFEKIAIYGISKGAELALLAASLIPDITCVIALSPSHCVYAGLGINDKGKKDLFNVSSFTWRGNPLPFVRGKKQIGGILWRFITQQQLNTCFIYKKALKSTTDDAVIKVENIKGPILLFSASEDATWPSQYSCEQIKKRLQTKKFAYPVKHVNYPHASHVLIPIANSHTLSKLRIYKVERKHPVQCNQSRSDAFEKSMEWLTSWGPAYSH